MNPGNELYEIERREKEEKRDKKVINLYYANNLKLFALCMLCCLIIHSIFKKKEKTKMLKKMYFLFLYNFNIIV